MGDSVGQPGTREFSLSAYKAGDLKRRLPIMTFAILRPAPGGGSVSTGIFTYRTVLKNLMHGLSVHIAAGLVGNDTSTLQEPAAIPPLSATIQLTPVNLFPSRPKLLLRPVFQNPAIANNSNNPLPQDLPFGWEFETVCDEIIIDLSINAALFILNQTGTMVLEVGIEYSGSWPFPEAVKYQLTQVQLVEVGAPVIIDTTIPT